ncbi:MAG TPA: ABC transporter permease [Candidatus Acidoferrales bacterium]|nr:ABC transporter permease [Candidatus Acidoferrales bacterium]
MGMRDLGRRLKYLLHRDEASGELDEEMRLHIELRTRQLQDRGLGEREARYAARREFGNRAMLEIAASDVWGWGPWERLAQDARYAARSLRKAPGFVAVAVVTLAVGLGMNTAVFSIVSAVMLRSLPYPEPGRLISLWEETPRRQDVGTLNSSGNNLGGVHARTRTTVAAANLMDYRKGAAAFEGLAGVETARMNLTGNGVPERLIGESVTANYFTVMGVAPQLGRTFTEEEDREGGDPVVVLSARFWERRLGSDTAVLDKTVMLDEKPYRVIGVMPRGFEPVTQYGNTEPVEFFVPAAYPKEQLAAHGDHDIGVVGRLKPGATLRTAQAQLDAVSAALAARYPVTNRGITAVIVPLRDDIVQSVSDSLRALLAASGLIVLITCVNVANLLLVRAVARRHETSVRLALGAGRGRIARAFLGESMLVSAAGCAAGIVLGRALMQVLVAAAPQTIPRLATVSMDWRVFSVAAAMTIAAGLVFGLAPAWQASRTRPSESLKATERRGGGTAQSRWRGALTVTEVALSLVLMVGAGLFLKSFTTIMGMDLGFRTEHVLAMNVNLPVLRYKTADLRLAFYQELERRVRALPGVQSVAYANRLPLRGGWSTGIEIENVSESNLSPDSQPVNPGYFEALGIPLVRGRLLTEEDRKGQPYVAVVNLAFARQYLKGGDPLGRRFRRGPQAVWFSIVGIVNDIRRGGKTKDMRPQIYLAAAQTDGYPVRLADFAVRTAGNPRLLANAIQRQVWGIDKDQPVTGVETMEELISESVAVQRFQMLLLGVFAGVAVLLAMIGVFGVLSYSVNQRMNELGVRIALGASPGRILGLVMQQAGGLVAAGAAFGLAGAWGLTRFVGHLLFHVESHDPATYAAAAGILAVVGLAAAMGPALRGARVDPAVTLREE